MGDPRHDLGRAAEQAVAAWLVAAGWTVHARRRRSAHGGEVDLVALDPAGVLVAVEVRARRSGRVGSAASTVDAERVDRLRRTLASVAGEIDAPHRGLRIDLVTAEPEPGSANRWRLRRIPDIGAW
ncbi:MAG: YraN family protein [Candidatus Limnocylindria bacterium]